MATLRQIVTDALRDLGVLTEAEEAPAETAARGLRLAEGLILECCALASQPFCDVDAPADYLAGENERVRPSGGAVVTRPVSIETHSGRGSLAPADGVLRRPPWDFSRIQIAGESPQTYAYIAEFGAWQRIDGLALTDENPLGPSTDAGLTAALALRLNRGRGETDLDITGSALQFRLWLTADRRMRPGPTAGTYH
jgi:hypothetical protein